MTNEAMRAPAATSVGRKVGLTEWPYSGLFWVCIAAVGCFAFFWGGITSLLDAWSRPEYSHGPLIPIIAGFLLLRELRNDPQSSDQGGSLIGLAVTVLGLLVGLLGNLTQIPDLITYGLILAIGGLILVMAGARRGAQFWVGWVYLFFMLPLPNMIYWPLSVKLQFISSRLGVDFIQMLGIPVYLDGNIIDLGVYKLQVAEACNGLRYLFPLTSFGFLFAALYRGPAWHKIVLFLSTIPITILMNSFRIGVIGVLVNYFGIAQAEGFLHWFEGWIVFVACIAVLYLEAIILQRFTVPRVTQGVLDLDTTGLLGLSRMLRLPGRKNLVTVSLVLLACGTLWQLLPTNPSPVIARETLAVFPMELGGWTGVRQERLDPVIEQALAADEYLLADYRKVPDKASVNLLITYYKKTTGGAGIHSPSVCIPGGGWEVSQWEQRLISPGTGNFPAFKVNRAIIRKGDSKQLVYYWYELRGRRLTDEYSAKFYAMWDSFTKSRTDGALIRLVTTMPSNEPEANADRRLTEFMQSVIATIPAYIPK